MFIQYWNGYKKLHECLHFIHKCCCTFYHKGYCRYKNVLRIHNLHVCKKSLKRSFETYSFPFKMGLKIIFIKHTSIFSLFFTSYLEDRDGPVGTDPSSGPEFETCLAKHRHVH